MNGKRLIGVFSCVCGFVLMAETNTFARYQSVIDRMPFGPEPEGFDPTKPPSEQKRAGASEVGPDGLTDEQRRQQAEKALGAVRVCAFNVTPGGQIAVGFTDSSAKPEVNYYLYAGQEKNGWKVVSAKEENGVKSVTLAKDGAEATLNLGDSTTGGPKGGKRPANGAPPRVLGRAAGTPPPVGAAVARPGGGSPALLRLSERRRLRQQNEEKKKADAAKAAEERKIREAEEQERKAQEAEERAAQRKQLADLAAELKRQREQREAEKAREKAGGTAEE